MANVNRNYNPSATPPNHGSSYWEPYPNMARHVRQGEQAAAQRSEPAPKRNHHTMGHPYSCQGSCCWS